MRSEALKNVRAAIEANAERRSLDQLRAQGKRHVRVVSGDRLNKIISAIVGDIIDREVGKIAQQDRDRIVDETRTQFDRVMKMQNDQESLIKEQKELVTQYKADLERVEGERRRLATQLEQKRSEWSAREAQLLADCQQEIQDASEKWRGASDREKELATQLEWAESEKAQLESRLERNRAEWSEREAAMRADAGEKLRAATEQLESRLERNRAEWSEREAAMRAARDGDVARLAQQVEQDRQVIEQAREALAAKEVEVERLNGELMAARENAGATDAVSSLRNEMERMKQALESRPTGPDEETLQRLMEASAQRQAMDTSALEERFSASLDRSLDQITKTMELATAKPLDVEVEATDVLIDKLFDYGDDELSTNLDDLDVEVKTTRGAIASNLARLKAMRVGQKAAGEAEEEGSQEAGEKEEEVSGGDEAVVADSTKEKMRASAERLKAVRGGDSGKN